MERDLIRQVLKVRSDFELWISNKIKKHKIYKKEVINRNKANTPSFFSASACSVNSCVTTFPHFICKSQSFTGPQISAACIIIPDNKFKSSLVLLNSSFLCNFPKNFSTNYTSPKKLPKSSKWNFISVARIISIIYFLNFWNSSRSNTFKILLSSLLR